MVSGGGMTWSGFVETIRDAISFQSKIKIVQSKSGFSQGLAFIVFCIIRTMAFEAVGRENRADVL